MNKRHAFTLIELLLVMAIMGLLGTISIGGYRAMRRGMEEHGVDRNVTKFLQVADQRAKIDGVPVAVVFWNETRQLEDPDDSTKTLLVVGRAAAVRRAGRVSHTSSSHVIDEFGDLKYYVLKDKDGKEKSNDNDVGTRIYMMKGNELKYSLVKSYTENVSAEKGSISVMMTDSDWQQQNVPLYGYKITAGNGNAEEWKAGQAYGFEFAELTLPNNYIFGKDDDYSKDKDGLRSDDVATMWFTRSGSSGGPVSVSAMRPNDEGELEAKVFMSISASTIEKLNGE